MEPWREEPEVVVKVEGMVGNLVAWRVAMKVVRMV